MIEVQLSIEYRSKIIAENYENNYSFVRNFNDNFRGRRMTEADDTMRPSDAGLFKRAPEVANIR